MNHYENSKKPRRIASITYLLIMAVILGGTFLSNQQKELAKKEASLATETPSDITPTSVQN
jgi:hypothetical protein